ncbi:MAG: hypothetical protein IT379_11960 [Deltaproteobacteria bacterium]|nr:hypothetical protein [Deltaproteobacteria bacterium]
MPVVVGVPERIDVTRVLGTTRFSAVLPRGRVELVYRRAVCTDGPRSSKTLDVHEDATVVLTPFPAPCSSAMERLGATQGLRLEP